MHPLLLKTKGFKPRKGVVKQCFYCGIDVYWPPCRAKTYKDAFCTREHLLAYQKSTAVEFSFNCLVCGEKVITVPSQMRLRNRQTCSMKCRSALQKVKTLERRKTYTKHQLDRLARYSSEAAEWRKAVFERDNYTCKECDVRGGYLEADHIKPWAFFPELRFELSNGRTLCRPCHDKTKISAKAMRELYSSL